MEFIYDILASFRLCTEVIYELTGNYVAALILLHWFAAYSCCSSIISKRVPQKLSVCSQNAQNPRAICRRPEKDSGGDSGSLLSRGL
jgi:hypothetical protein